VSVIVLRGYKPSPHRGPFNPDEARIRRRCVACWPFWEGSGGTAENIVTGQRAPITWGPNSGGGSPNGWRALQYGIGIACTENEWVNTGVTRLGSVGLFAAATEQWTLVVRASAWTNLEGTVFAKAGPTIANRNLQIQYNRPNAPERTPTIFVRGTANHTNWGLDDFKLHSHWITWDGATCRAYHDDARGALTLNVGTAVEETAEPFMFGARNAGGANSALNGDLDFGAILDVALTPAEIKRWQQNLYAPWERPLFRPYPPPIYFPLATLGPPRPADEPHAAEPVS